MPYEKKLGKWLLVSGLTLVVIGLGWYFIDWKKSATLLGFTATPPHSDQAKTPPPAMEPQAPPTPDQDGFTTIPMGIGDVKKMNEAMRLADEQNKKLVKEKATVAEELTRTKVEVAKLKKDNDALQLKAKTIVNPKLEDELKCEKDKTAELAQQLKAEAEKAKVLKVRALGAESKVATLKQIVQEVTVLKQALERMRMQQTAPLTPPAPPVAAVPATPAVPPVMVELPNPGPMFRLEVTSTFVDNPGSKREIAVVVEPTCGLWVGNKSGARMPPPQIALPQGVQEQPNLRLAALWFPAENRWVPNRWICEVPPWLRQQHRQ